MAIIYDETLLPPFRVGDVVRLKTGRSRQVVREIDMFRRMAKVEYVSAMGIPPRWREFNELELDEFDLDDDRVDDEKENTMSGKLYQTNTSPALYGTFLARNSKGQVVLEMKGKDGGVQAFDPSEIEEVIPYTIEVRNLITGNPCNVEIGKDVVEVDDLILDNGNIFQVVGLDTKCKNAGKFKSPRVIETNPLRND